MYNKITVMDIKPIFLKMKKNYYQPTPKKWRKLGDALLGVALMGIPADLAGYKWIGITLFVLGIIGKFLTNFFTEDEIL